MKRKSSFWISFWAGLLGSTIVAVVGSILKSFFDWNNSFANVWETAIFQLNLKVGHVVYFLTLFAVFSSIFFPLYRKVQRKKERISLITNSKDLITKNVEIVEQAQKKLVCTGSRARDFDYFKAIEKVLALNEELIHYRVLWGEPHNIELKNHMKRLLTIRNPKSRTKGEQTIFLGLFNDELFESEKFVIANEKTALVILPSISGIGHYDTAIVFENCRFNETVINYVDELYAASSPLESVGDIEDLKTKRSDSTPARGR